MYRTTHDCADRWLCEADSEECAVAANSEFCGAGLSCFRAAGVEGRGVRSLDMKSELCPVKAVRGPRHLKTGLEGEWVLMAICPVRGLPKNHRGRRPE